MTTTCEHLHYCVTRDDETDAVSWWATADEAAAEAQRLDEAHDGHRYSWDCTDCDDTDCDD